MAYLVKIASRAERDLTRLYEAINATHSEAALEWYGDLKKAIFSLQEKPNRCPEAHEKNGLRHLLYGHMPHIYRVIYRILERQKSVEVLHVRHGARQELKTSDLK
jgi:toxin ParE1/3/4